MNPILALGLVAAAGIAVTRLPRFSVKRLPHYDVIAAAGGPLVLLGVLLGPGLGVLDQAVLDALAPVTALAIGWLGAVFGSRFEWRFVRRIPLRVGGLLLLQAAAVFTVTAWVAWALLRWQPALAAAWAPTLPAVLTLAAIATVSGPGAVALVAQAAGIRRSLSHAFGLAAALDTAFGALGFTLALALYHPREPVGGVVLGWYTWTALALGSGLLVGMLFLSLSRLRPDRGDLGLSLLGVVLFGSGVGYAADLSPFVVCALGAMVIVNVSPAKRAVQELLISWEHPIYAVFLITAGAILRLPTIWILLGVIVLAALRIFVRWAVVRFGRPLFRAHDLPPDVGFATVAQGGVALALAINFYITYDNGAAVVTTAVLGLALAQAVAPALMRRALRLAPVAPPPAPPPAAPPAPVPSVVRSGVD